MAAPRTRRPAATGPLEHRRRLAVAAVGLAYAEQCGDPDRWDEVARAMPMATDREDYCRHAIERPDEVLAEVIGYFERIETPDRLARIRTNLERNARARWTAEDVARAVERYG